MRREFELTELIDGSQDLVTELTELVVNRARFPFPWICSIDWLTIKYFSFSFLAPEATLKTFIHLKARDTSNGVVQCGAIVD